MLQTVRTTFAKMLGMHPTSCQLYYNGDQLADQPIRQASLVLFRMCTLIGCKPLLASSIMYRLKATPVINYC